MGERRRRFRVGRAICTPPLFPQRLCKGAPDEHDSIPDLCWSAGLRDRDRRPGQSWGMLPALSAAHDGQLLRDGSLHLLQLHRVRLSAGLLLWRAALPGRMPQGHVRPQDVDLSLSLLRRVRRCAGDPPRCSREVRAEPWTPQVRSTSTRGTSLPPRHRDTDGELPSVLSVTLWFSVSRHAWQGPPA